MQKSKLLKNREVKLIREDVLSPKNYGWAGALAVALSVIFSAAINSFNSWSNLAIANTGAIVLCILIFYALRFIINLNKSKKEISYFTILTCGVILGFTKGMATALFLSILDETATFSDEVLMRILQAPLLGAWVLLGIEVVNAQRLRFDRMRTSLIQEKVRASIGEQNQVSRPQEIDDFINNSRNILRDLRAADHKDNTATATIIRESMARQLRPLSHQLWDAQEVKYPKYKFNDLFRASIVARPFSPKFTALAQGVVGLAFYVNNFGWPLGLAALGTVLTFIWLSLWTLNGFGPANHRNRWLRFALGLALSIASATIPAMLLRGVSDSEFWIPLLLTNIAWLSLLVTITAVAKEAITANSKVERELSEASNLDKTAGEVASALSARNLAQHLHGNVHNKLLSSAMRLERAGTVDNLAVLERELDLVEQVLDRLESRQNLDENQTLAATVQSCIDVWAGTIAVDVASLPEAAITQVNTQLLGEVINEAIANAFRHGNASKVILKFDNHDGELWLHVIDNGSGYRPRKRGLGSELFSQYAGANWTMKNRSGLGTELKIKVS